MGGLPCRKAALDGGAQARADVTKTMAGLDRMLKCLENTAAGGPDTFTDEMEDKYLEASSRFSLAVKTAAGVYASTITELEEEARNRWPPGSGGEGYKTKPKGEAEKE